MHKLTTGMTGTAKAVVGEEMTAKAMGSGSLPVFATPAMVALMEQAACNALAPFLEPDETTVGTSLNINHCAATPLHMEVEAVATLVQMDRRKLEFSIECRDACGVIGTGTHERFLVNSERFLNNALGKAGDA